MRNIFDQYQAPENRLTHALASSLERDPKLLRSFLRWVLPDHSVAPREVHIVEQSIPGEADPAADEVERGGLPDMWLFDDDMSWSLLVEAKVASRVGIDQLRRHLAIANRQGVQDAALLVLAPRLPSERVRGGIYRTWPEVYSWAQAHRATSEWAGALAEYMEIAEVRMTADGYLKDEPLTEFHGIPFFGERPYSYGEAKRVLRLLRSELIVRDDLREFGADPAAPGRPAITGKTTGSVWDFLALRGARGESAFTRFPHLTFSLDRDQLSVMVTLPNEVRRSLRRHLVDLGEDGFAELAVRVGQQLARVVRRVDKARPHMYVVQRHFPSQRSLPTTDARLAFDPLTAVGDAGAGVKAQPQWIQAAYATLADKHSNLQVGIGAHLPYGDPALRQKSVTNVIAGVWIACRPWLNAVLGGAG